MSKDRRDDEFAEEPLHPDDEGPRRPVCRKWSEDDEGPTPKKSNTTMIVVLSIVGAVVLLCAGCGIGGYFFIQNATEKFREVAEQTERINDLRELGILYINFNDKHKRPPTNLAEFEKGGAHGKSLHLVREGEIKVIWDVPLNKAKDNNNVILAYYWKPEANDHRLVLFADGSTRAVPEGEFAIALDKLRAAAAQTRGIKELHELGIFYHNFNKRHKQPPANLADLEKNVERRKNGDERITSLQLVRQGLIKVIWGAPLNQAKGNSNLILAYFINPETNGNRVVLFADGSARALPEGEFATTPKAQVGPQKQ